MASPALSQASTAFEHEAPQAQDDQKTPRRPVLRRVREIAASEDVLLFLIAFRIVNALSIRTFFQPDEYFQSLEPAWEIAFGANSGAWITWEWRNQLRSAIHPAIFAAVYKLCVEASKPLQLSPAARDELFLAAPKVTQAVIAALGDYYTWKLGERVYGRATGNETVDEYGLRPDPGTDLAEEIPKCVPENVKAIRRERIVLVLEAAICGTIVLFASVVVDRIYYQQWTFPPSRFLYFNLARSLSVHYGRNPWHYYLTQGYPLLLTTYLPFTLLGLYQSLFPLELPTSQTRLTRTMKRQLATSSLLIPFALSFISHKEVRFIYPLLPPLHILSAAPFSTYLGPLLQSPALRNRKSKKAVLLTILAFNFLLALFTTALYQTAPLTTIAYLRSRTLASSSSSSHATTTAAFLTPCHSTPWRSHLLHPTLKAWALSCHPPLHLPDPATHATYLDEADQFYASPTHWLSLQLGRPPRSLGEQQARLLALETATGVAWDGVEFDRGRERKKAWTAYLVMFGQLEEEMAKVLKGSGYGVCRREWNGWKGWHEDWRRRGGMVIWCLDEGEKRKWRQVEKEREEERGWRNWVWQGRT
ncbi:MAG: hypothetical protein LQ346_006199 [Caloplaca aetnensis]|nr:MAG: hypothetical protein LQ346_006199 [Caloplaca aetnensis]